MDQLRQVDDVCSRFESAWSTVPGNRPRIEAFLDAVPEAARRALVNELVALEIELRRRAGENPQRTEYVCRFPALETQTAQSSVDPNATRLGDTRGTLAAPGRYRALRPLGSGGLGEVFVAHDEELHREVALKQIQARHGCRGQALDRFLLEAEVTGRLEHPGVVPVYSLGRHPDGRPYYAMRLIKGETFEAAIEHFHKADVRGRDPGERSLAFRELLRRFVDVCNAIAYAHSKGVLHRDLKPANVMLGPYGETLVIDWGLAKVLGQPAVDVSAAASVLQGSRLKSPGHTGLAGSPSFMSPEQAEERQEEIGPASDVYSLGAILYSLLTGQNAFGGGNLSQVLLQVRSGEFAPPRRVNATVPTALEAVCLKAMALRSGDRYRSAKALAADVEHWLADEPVSAHREPLPARVRRWGRRHRALIGTLVALLVTATAALTVSLLLVDAEQQKTKAALERVTRERQDKELALARVTEEQRKTEAALTRVGQERQEKETALTHVTEEKGKTDAALERSRRAEASAAEQRQLALQTMRRVLDNIDKGLKDRPGLQDLRKELLREALDGLQKVARAADTAPALDHATVEVHAALGDLFLQFDGGVQSAREQYQKAHEVALRRAADGPNDPEAQRDLSLTHSKMGEVYRVQGALGSALASHEAALTIRRRLASPRDAAAQQDLSNSHYNLGEIHALQGALPSALASFQDGLRISRKLADADPGNATLQRDVPSFYDRIAAVQREQGDLQAASSSFQEALRLRKKFADANPGNAAALRDLAVSHSNIGDVYIGQGDPGAARASYQEALTIRQTLLEADPTSAAAQRALAGAHSRMGSAQFRLREPKAALASHNAALRISLKLAAADPSNATVQYDLILCHERLGDVQRQQKDISAALASYREALRISQALVDADPSNAHAQRGVHIYLGRIGDVEQQQGDLKAALASHQDALKIGRKLAALDPSNATAQRDLAYSHSKIGDVLLKMGDDAGALASFHDGLAIRQKLAAADPSNALVQRYLLESNLRIGTVAQQRDDFATAIGWYQKALDVGGRFPRPESFAADVRSLEARIRVCRGAELVLKDPVAVQNVSEVDRPGVLNAVIGAHVRRRAPEKAVAFADRLATSAKNSDQLYDAARGYALCVPLADRPAKDNYAARAVALLKQVVARGYKDVNHMKTDADLAALRERDDFKALLKELEAMNPQTSNHFE
jgi:serine/threonine protein kinase/tetratricopeptide (TPR) repeat protein